MSKPTVYLDTNIFSAMYYRGGDPLALKEQLTTREWWQGERGFFKLFASKAVEDELAAGEFPNQAKALAEARRLPFLPFVAAVRETAARFVAGHIVPETAAIDAHHLAFATVYSVDYLLSWNRAHLVTAEIQGKLARFRATWGLRTPLVVSPASIPKAALGEDIRRRD
ncbi:MAG: PIN domain-containing protein [Planctomycetota bacterium]